MAIEESEVDWPNPESPYWQQELPALTADFYHLLMLHDQYAAYRFADENFRQGFNEAYGLDITGPDDPRLEVPDATRPFAKWGLVGKSLATQIAMRAKDALELQESVSDLTEEELHDIQVIINLGYMFGLYAYKQDEPGSFVIPNLFHNQEFLKEVLASSEEFSAQL